MKWYKHRVEEFLKKLAQQQGSAQTASHSSHGATPSSAPTPTASGNTSTASATSHGQQNATKPSSGERQQKVTRFQSVDASSVLPNSSETWARQGDVLEGTTVETKVITASGGIVETSDLKSICSICGLAEDSVIRSEVSQVTLCNACKKIFIKPDGSEMVVSPAEFTALTHQFNTWEQFDRLSESQPTKQS